MTEKITKPLIAVTMGDPAGVGPEIILKALANGALPKRIAIWSLATGKYWKKPPAS